MIEVASGIFVRPGQHDLMRRENFGGIANIGFIVGKEAVAVVDTGGSICDGRRLRLAIKAKTALPVRFVINTHVHPDHIFGNGAFAGDATIFVGHRNLPRAMAARAKHYLRANQELMGEALLRGTKIIAPTLLVKDRFSLQLGDRELRLRAWPAAHTDQDLTILDVKTATLFTGDLIFREHIPVLDGHLVGWLKAMEMLRQSMAKQVVPGHGGITAAAPVLKMSDALAPQMNYLKTLAADVRSAIKRGATMSHAVATVALSEKSKWQLFEDFNARNATAAFAELEWE